MSAPPLRLVALEITRRCNLACKHCRGDSRNESYPNELSLDEITAVLDNVSSKAQPIIIITGGEPLIRNDVFDITAYSTSRGLRTVLATCGHLLTEETVQKLINTGVSRISVSLDGTTSDVHDSFRGVNGAFDSALMGLKTARKYGLDFQINSTLTTINIEELEALHNMAVSVGAVAFHPFLFVPMGRGKGLADSALSGEEYEAALIRIAEIASRSPIEIKPTCSPHYTRVVKQTSSGSSGLSGVSALSGEPEPFPSVQSLSPRTFKHPVTRGCLGAQGFVFVSHIGKVQMCGFLEIEAGDLRTCQYDLNHIWETSAFFKEIRDVDSYNGKCGVCEYRNICGGCRARAYYAFGNYLAEEPNCIYIPQRTRT